MYFSSHARVLRQWRVTHVASSIQAAMASSPDVRGARRFHLRSRRRAGPVMSSPLARSRAARGRLSVAHVLTGASLDLLDRDQAPVEPDVSRRWCGRRWRLVAAAGHGNPSRRLERPQVEGRALRMQPYGLVADRHKRLVPSRRPRHWMQMRSSQGSGSALSGANDPKRTSASISCCASELVSAPIKVLV